MNKLWVALVGLLLLTACSGYAIIIKTRCGLYADFTVDKCVVYPKVKKEK